MTRHECPLCSTDFEGAECHSSCPMARGCAMVRCPKCGYEFVESGRIVDMLRRWIRRAPAPSRSGLQPLTNVAEGTVAPVASIRASTGRVNRLASFGIVPGSQVRVVARKPTVVLQCGSTSLALEEDVAREILVAIA